MGLLRQVAQLAHVAQHRHPAVAFGLGQHLQRRGDGLEVGVVAVVQDDAPFGQPHHPHPGTGGLIGCRPPDDLVVAQAQLLGHRHSDGRGIGHIDARRGNGQMVNVLRRLHRAGDSLHTVVGHLGDAGLAVLRLAAADSAEWDVHGVQQGIVSVEDSQSALLQMRENLAFRLQDALTAAQKFDMSVADVGDDRHIRTHHSAQILDLPKMVHAGLDDRRLVLGAQAQQGQGRTDVVVEILRGL